MRSRSISIVAVATVAAFLACGGGDRLQGPGVGEDGEEPTPLDFSAISGTWSAWGEDSVGAALWLIIEMEAKVGSSSVGVSTGVVECAADLIARAADSPRFVVGVRSPPEASGCVDGERVLQHDSQSGTLQADFTARDDSFTGHHDLTRGGDPGPRP